MSSVVYNIRLDEELKAQSFAVFEDYGLTPAQAIKMFLKQTAETNKIPLSLDYKPDYMPNTETAKVMQPILDGTETMNKANSVDELMEQLHATD